MWVPFLIAAEMPQQSPWAMPSRDYMARRAAGDALGFVRPQSGKPDGCIQLRRTEGPIIPLKPDIRVSRSAQGKETESFSAIPQSFAKSIQLCCTAAIRPDRRAADALLHSTGAGLQR